MVQFPDELPVYVACQVPTKGWICSVVVGDKLHGVGPTIQVFVATEPAAFMMVGAVITTLGGFVQPVVVDKPDVGST